MGERPSYAKASAVEAEGREEYSLRACNNLELIKKGPGSLNRLGLFILYSLSTR